MTPISPKPKTILKFNTLKNLHEELALDDIWPECVHVCCLRQKGLTVLRFDSSSRQLEPWNLSTSLPLNPLAPPQRMCVQAVMAVSVCECGPGKTDHCDTFCDSMKTSEHPGATFLWVPSGPMMKPFSRYTTDLWLMSGLQADGWIISFSSRSFSLPPFFRLSCISYSPSFSYAYLLPFDPLLCRTSLTVPRGHHDCAFFCVGKRSSRSICSSASHTWPRWPLSPSAFSPGDQWCLTHPVTQVHHKCRPGRTDAPSEALSACAQTTYRSLSTGALWEWASEGLMCNLETGPGPPGIYMFYKWLTCFHLVRSSLTAGNLRLAAQGYVFVGRHSALFMVSRPSKVGVSLHVSRGIKAVGWAQHCRHTRSRGPTGTRLTTH